MSDMLTETNLNGDSVNGFIGGDFASGLVRKISTTGCWTMQFSSNADILAVGLKGRVQCLETNGYATLCDIEMKGKVSSIQWCGGSPLSVPSREESKTVSSGEEKESANPFNRQEEAELMAVADLDGHARIYQIEPLLLEIKGPQAIYELQVDGEIRCMVLKALEGYGVVLIVGDKRGKVTMVTLNRDFQSNSIVATAPLSLDLGGDAVLGLDCNVRGGRRIIAIGTKSGQVIVHKLQVSQVVTGRNIVSFGEEIWRTQRNGSVRAVVISDRGNYVAFGGYDKTVVRFNVQLRAIVRELDLGGTVNTLAFDSLDRYLMVGCRDKSVTIFDVTTFFAIKRFETNGWVTAISCSDSNPDLIAVRSENKAISLLDISPTRMTNIKMPTEEDLGSSVTWSPSGALLARVVGDTIEIVDSMYQFSKCASIDIPGSRLQNVVFAPNIRHDDNTNQRCMFLSAVGLDGDLHLLKFTSPDSLEMIFTKKLQPDLWIASWSLDGRYLAVGGKGKVLSLFSFHGEQLKFTKSLQLDGRIWDIGFNPALNNESGAATVPWALAVACGDYKTHFFTLSLESSLQVVRNRTVRCLDFHPQETIVAIGDGAGLVVIVDYLEEEIIREIDVGHRVSVVKFSPCGDILLIGADNCSFTLHETKTYRSVQELSRESFASAAAFSPNGMYLALGNTHESYVVIRLGALLGIDLVPLDLTFGKLPDWALHQTLFRSAFGPTLVQRHMIRGNSDSIAWVNSILKEYPDAIYAVDRSRSEGCLETALRLKKAKLLQVSVKTIVDGTLEKQGGGKRSILTTRIPEIGRETLEAMLVSHPAALIVEILQSLTFVKVPFTSSHILTRDEKLVRGCKSYLDPWRDYPSLKDFGEDEGKISRIPAVLPIPGLGTMDFLSALLANAPAAAFDTEAMDTVLKVLWKEHIRKIYIVDTVLFIFYFGLWVLLIERSAVALAEDDNVQGEVSTAAIALSVIAFNTLFAAKEMIESSCGRQPGYFASNWNLIDITSIALVYGYSVSVAVGGVKGDKLVPLAVVTTLLLTMKLISYLRAFNQTGWLVTVLSRNFWDVRGFLLVLLVIIVGFSASFRLLFATGDQVCELELDPETDELVQSCLPSPFGSFRRAVLSTFELTILGSYEQSLLFESRHSVLSVAMFVLAVTCVLVVALNALISLLADSYARVQEDATANKRREKAELIVEYMRLMPARGRRRIERNTTYFHALLEADEEGDLVVEDDDWHGGLNALRDDIEESNKMNTEAQAKAIEHLKTDFERDLAAFRSEILSVLDDLAEDIKAMKKVQATGGVTTAARGAVKAVRDIGKKGTSIFKSGD